MNNRRIPLLLDHLQEVSMVDDMLEDGAQRKTIVATECCGKADDWDLVLGDRFYGCKGLIVVVWMSDFRVKIR